MQFELFVAARYLRAKRRQAVIGVITVISIVGVAAGVASLIIALAINNGFRQDLQERLLGSTSHINLLRVESDGIRNWQDLLARLQKQPHVLAGAPAIYEQVLISRGARAQGAILKGILPQDERRVSDILDTVKSGSADSLEVRKEDQGDDFASGPRRTQSALRARHRFPAADYSGQRHGRPTGRYGWVAGDRHQPARRAHAIWHCPQVQALQSDGNLLVELL